MMIDVTVADQDLDLGALYTHMNPLVAGAALVSRATDHMVFAVGSDKYVITGTGLTFRDGALQGGAVDALTLRRDGVDLIRFGNLQATGAEMWGAMLAEQTGADTAALTHLLVDHCWTYHGSAGVDYFPKTTLAGFGPLNLTGNDKIYLNGGDDVFFSGSAQDTVLGGSGNDQLQGGNGNDLLIGGTGTDKLYGDSADDRLDGGTGADSLLGGSGNDTLLGGKADDQLRGGAGADVFVFAGGAGADVIVDYQPGTDHLQITAALPWTITDMGPDSLVQFGSDSVLLQGVAANDLTAGDFV